MNIEISISEIPTVNELQKLFAQTTWASKRKDQDVKKMLEKLTVFVSIRENSKLVGFGRAISDEVYRALLEDIVVDTAYRGQGLGRVIVEHLMNQLHGIEEVFLNTGPHLEEFYQKYGFSKATCLTMKN